jgi:[ribosomal protein S18]-alanine N-acetyltransferase
MNPVIRKATAGDLDALYAIEQQGQARWTRGQFEDELRIAFSDVRVVDDGGTVIGFAVVWNVADEIQLNNIGVSRGCRRRGVGRMLIEHIVASGRGCGKRKICLEVSERNETAQRFYLNSGFTESGRRKRYYDGIDAILMERELEL